MFVFDITVPRPDRVVVELRLAGVDHPAPAAFVLGCDDRDPSLEPARAERLRTSQAYALATELECLAARELLDVAIDVTEARSGRVSIEFTLIATPAITLDADGVQEIAMQACAACGFEPDFAGPVGARK